MPRATGSPPHSSIRAARVVELMSRILPGPGCWSGATSSSPVLMIATLGRRCTGTRGDADAGQYPQVLRPQLVSPTEDHGVLRIILALADDIVPRRHRPLNLHGPFIQPVGDIRPSPRCPQATAGSRRSRSPRSGRVAARVPMAALPMATSPMMVSRAGSESLQPKVSRARTAKPSMVARANGGSGSGAVMSQASILPRPLARGTFSGASAGKRSSRPRKSTVLIS